MIRLGVNIDHVATLREVRKASQPDILLAALEALKGGADSITVHLREDERHIKYADTLRLRRDCPAPLNLEMSTDAEVLAKALTVLPDQATLVPERRQEITTERGLDLDVPAVLARTTEVVRTLQERGVSVSLFLDPTPSVLAKARLTGATKVELHTGAYAAAFATDRGVKELDRLREAARICRGEGLTLHAGHGLDTRNLPPLLDALAPFGLAELNIGHSIVCRAVFVGLAEAVAEVKRLLGAAP